jgi:hypothetical protein
MLSWLSPPEEPLEDSVLADYTKNFLVTPKNRAFFVAAKFSASGDNPKIDGRTSDCHKNTRLRKINFFPEPYAQENDL